MALARIEILEGRTVEAKQAMVMAVRQALSEALRAPDDDPLVRLTEYPAEQYTLPCPRRHSERFTLVEVTMFAGRSMDTKRRLYDAVISRLSALDVPAHDILIVLHEPPMHNWAVNGGTPADEADVGFEVEI
ncbi:MAG TPA: tautomerase family protein [Solirubrobacteraceae bacterium]|nr:tautomerase family protein [Solirubrobacteraceae bacterium]